MIKVEITGPGLVVNRSAAVIYQALIAAGYNVHMPEFLGQYQNFDPEVWADKEIDNERQQGMVIDVLVNPLPWGA